MLHGSNANGAVQMARSTTSSSTTYTVMASGVLFVMGIHTCPKTPIRIGVYCLSLSRKPGRRQYANLSASCKSGYLRSGIREDSEIARIDFLSGQFRKMQMYAFVEVFAGGASVGLSLLQAGIIQRLVLNDTDPGVYAFWKALKEEPKELLTRLAGKDPTLDDFRHAQEVLDHPEGRSLDELAWSELICNRLGYSGITKAGPIGGWNGTPAAVAFPMESIYSQ